MSKILSIIVPFYNEKENLELIYQKIVKALAGISYDYEIIFINDGSEDDFGQILKQICDIDPKVRVIEFSRNFGKEIAITAGLNKCVGDACITLDSDLQHPPELIPDFVKKWEDGAEVVVGIRKSNESDTILKKIGSYLFYKIINTISYPKLVPYSTDYRLLDRVVINEFNKFSEQKRITRGLIDWLGFKREYLYFNAGKRINGKATYSYKKLFKLAIYSIISLSLFPLKLAGYLGALIMFLSGAASLLLFIEDYLLRDPLSLNITGTAFLTLMILFLVGLILICIGIIAIYVAQIQIEVLNRPLYVVRPEKK